MSERRSYELSREDQGLLHLAMTRPRASESQEETRRFWRSLGQTMGFDPDTVKRETTATFTAVPVEAVEDTPPVAPPPEDFRDQVALEAMKTLMPLQCQYERGLDSMKLATGAYRIADAMIRARSAPPRNDPQYDADSGVQLDPPVTKETS